MTYMPKQQFDELLDRIRQLDEAEPATGVATDFTGLPTPQGEPAKGPAPVDIDKYKPNDNIPEIKANSISQAMEKARAQKLTKFRFCQQYGTNLGKKQPQSGQEVPQDPWSQAGGYNVKKESFEHMLNESVRSLSRRLNELKIGDINPQTGNRVTGGMTDGSGNLVGSGTPGVYWNYKEEPVATPAPVPGPEVKPVAEPEVKPVAEPEVKPQDGPTCDPETLAKIKYMPSFNKAFAAARQAGCDKFWWCGVYNVQPQSGQTEPPPAATGNTTLTRQSARHWAMVAKTQGIDSLRKPGGVLDPKSHTPQEVRSMEMMINNINAGKDPWAGIQRSPDQQYQYMNK